MGKIIIALLVVIAALGPLGAGSLAFMVAGWYMED